MSSKHQKGEEQILPYKGSLQNKKNSKKGDIVTIRSGTYLPYLNGDTKISEICSKTSYLPTPRKLSRNIPKIDSLKTLFCRKLC